LIARFALGNRLAGASSFTAFTVFAPGKGIETLARRIGINP